MHILPETLCEVWQSLSCLFLFYSQYRSPRLAMSSVTSVCLSKKSKNSHKEWKDFPHLKQTPVPLSLQKFPGITAAVYEA